MGLGERAEKRRQRMVGHVAHSHKEAEDWDLGFWQSLTPQQRLQAYFALLEDVQKVQQARAHAHPASETEMDKA